MLDVTRLRVLDSLARNGSVTAAAKELNYTQPTVSHHLARLEAETGAQLLQRVGRSVRLTPAGALLADRASEILGRLDGAGAELAAHVGLRAGRVRMASFASAIGSLVPRAVAGLTAEHPGLRVEVTNTHPLESMELLRTGKIEVAIIFRYGDTAPEPGDIRLHPLLDDPLFLLSTEPGQTLDSCRDATWIGGCERCRTHLLAICAEAGFEPRIDFVTDDLIVMQSLVAAGLGVSTLPGLALRTHRLAGVEATEIPGSHQRVYAATYGDPPDPPATSALLSALAGAARGLAGVRG